MSQAIHQATMSVVLIFARLIPAFLVPVQQLVQNVQTFMLSVLMVRNVIPIVVIQIASFAALYRLAKSVLMASKSLPLINALKVAVFRTVTCATPRPHVSSVKMDTLSQEMGKAAILIAVYLIALTATALQHVLNAILDTSLRMEENLVL